MERRFVFWLVDGRAPQLVQIFIGHITRGLTSIGTPSALSIRAGA